jgi:PRTRC genetic system ThiF family protein
LNLQKGHRHHRDEPKYWLDFGNSQYTGQVILSTIGAIKQPKSEKYETVASLPFVTEEFGELLKQSEQQDDTPSCSLAEALEKQDLFINSALTQMGCSLLWSLFRYGMTENRGFFLNLRDFRSQPIKIA